MPELPEVETVRRGLAPAMSGGVITNVRLNRANLRYPFPPNFARSLENQRINSVSRRAKYLTLWLDNNQVLIMHLGMSGSFHVELQNSAEPDEIRNRLPAHDHVIFSITNRNQQYKIIYNDPRRFGFMDLIDADQIASNRHLSRLGVEPTGNELNGELLDHLFSEKTQPLKSVLLDQSLIAGLGNIYVCEALWRSKLSPKRKAKTICRKTSGPSARAGLLANSIRDIINEAILAGGSTLSDHRQTDGTLGYFQHRFSVYDREGEPCLHENCGGTINRITQSGRSTYYCPSCQR